jgi:predicted RND superfamily exporter protein
LRKIILSYFILIFFLTSCAPKHISLEKNSDKRKFLKKKHKKYNKHKKHKKYNKHKKSNKSNKSKKSNKSNRSKKNIHSSCGKGKTSPIIVYIIEVERKNYRFIDSRSSW